MNQKCIDPSWISLWRENNEAPRERPSPIVLARCTSGRNEKNKDRKHGGENTFPRQFTLR